MIKIGTNFVVEKYEHGWKVIETVATKPSEKNPKGSTKVKTRYFSTPLQAFFHVLYEHVPEQGQVEDIIRAINTAGKKIEEAIQQSDRFKAQRDVALTAYVAERTGRLGGKQLSDEEMEAVRERADKIWESLQ